MALTPSRPLILATGGPGWPSQRHRGGWRFGVAPTPSRPPTPDTGHPGWLPQAPQRVVFWRGPMHPPGFPSPHWPPRTAPLEAPRWGVRRLAPYTLQAPHPRHWPPRMAPLGPPQRRVRCVAPCTFQAFSSSPLATQGGSLVATAEGYILRRPNPPSRPPSPPLATQDASLRASAEGASWRAPIHPPGPSPSSLATQDGTLGATAEGAMGVPHTPSIGPAHSVRALHLVLHRHSFDIRM